MKKSINRGLFISLIILFVTSVAFSSGSRHIFSQLTNTPNSHALIDGSDSILTQYTPELIYQHDVSFDHTRNTIIPKNHHHKASLGLNIQVYDHNISNAPRITSEIKKAFRIRSSAYEEHDSISIDGNSDFINQANEENWPGDGTALNPYVITGYEIIGSGSENLIDIRETNIHFRISDCKLDNGYTGIFLSDVTNGEVSNNEVTDSVEGISLVYCQDVGVENNTLSNNMYGINLYFSGNNIVTSNTLIAGGLYVFGEEFEDFVQTKVSDNTVNGEPIVFWQDVSSRTLPLDAGQIFLVNCTSIEVTDQNLVGLSVGLVTAFCTNINIHSNTISNNIRGMYLRLSNNITVFNNTYADNERGLFLSESGNNSILNNTFVKDGLYIYGGSFEAIQQTNVSSNFVNGKPLIFWQDTEDNAVPVGAGQVILINCSSIEVKSQKLDNTAVGLIAHYCNDLDVHDNSMDNNFWGIYMENTNNSDFIRNVVSNNGLDGVYLEDSCNNIFIFNHFINNNAESHVVNYGYNNIFSGNYWSNWTSPDFDGDGIVDNSYRILGYVSYDLSPLVSPNTHLLLPPVLITPNAYKDLSGNTTVQWSTPQDSLRHDLTYSIYYSIDNGKTWTQLASDLETTSYKWDSFVSDTNRSFYIIKIVVTCSEGLTTEVISANYHADSPRIAYIYSTSITSANSYKTLLESHGFATDLIPLNNMTKDMFNMYDLILIGTETAGYLGGITWGDEDKVSAIDNSRKPIIGLGEGGYYFFGELGLDIGYGHGWHGTDNSVYAVDGSHSIFNHPCSIATETIQLYTSTSHVGIYLSTPANDIVLLGRELGDENHYPLVQEKNRYLLWGFTGSPNSMTQTGKDLFINILVYFVTLPEIAPIASDNTVPPFDSEFIILLLIIGVIGVFVFINISSHYTKRRKPTPRPSYRSKPTTIKEPAVQKEISAKLPQEIIQHEAPEPEPFVPAVPLDTETIKKPITAELPTKPVSEEIKSKFQSIEYQVQDLIFKQGKTGPIVLIIPYSGSIKEIMVEFSKDQVHFSGYLKRQNLPQINFELKIDGEPRETSWIKPWQDITLIGDKKIISRIKRRNEIADRMTSLGTAIIKVESPVKGEIWLHITCNETQEAIKLTYSLIKDLQLFFDISLY